MAITTYEHGEYYALAGIKAQVGSLALINSVGTELAEEAGSSTTYTQGALGAQGSDLLDLTDSVTFTIGSGDVNQTATGIRVKTGIGGETLLEIDLTTSQLFELEGTYTLTASTISFA